MSCLQTVSLRGRTEFQRAVCTGNFDSILGTHAPFHALHLPTCVNRKRVDRVLDL